MGKSPVLMALAALVVSGKALAELSYSHVQVDLKVARLCDEDDSNDCLDDLALGYGLHGSAAVGANFHGFLDFTNEKFRSGDFSRRFISTSLGFGAHVPISGNVDFFGGASFERFRITLSFDGDSEGQSWNGWGLMAGVRGELPARMEWNTSLKYRDIAQVDAIIGVAVGLRRHFTPAGSLGLDISQNFYEGVSDTAIALNFRYHFGNRQ